MAVTLVWTASELVQWGQIKILVWPNQRRMCPGEISGCRFRSGVYWSLIFATTGLVVFLWGISGAPVKKIPYFIRFISAAPYASYSLSHKLDHHFIVPHWKTTWTFYAILTCLPKYLNNVHGFDLSQSGFVSSLPYIVMWLTIISQVSLKLGIV